MKIPCSSSRSGWLLRNIHISNDNESLTFYVEFFFPLSLPRFFPDLAVYMSNTAGVLNSPPVFFLVGSVLLVICVLLLCIFTFWVAYYEVHHDFRKKMFGSSWSPVVCREGLMFYCVFVYVQHFVLSSINMSLCSEFCVVISATNPI
jgi:hypothetical protein